MKDSRASVFRRVWTSSDPEFASASFQRERSSGIDGRQIASAAIPLRTSVTDYNGKSPRHIHIWLKSAFSASNQRHYPHPVRAFSLRFGRTAANKLAAHSSEGDPDLFFQCTVRISQRWLNGRTDMGIRIYGCIIKMTNRN